MPGFTAFPNGITSLGIPTFGTGSIPPFTGKYFFVKEVTTAGVAAGNGTAQQPFNTLALALAQCVSGRGDVIFLEGSLHVTATVNWNLNNTHLVGVAAPSNNTRARISASGTVFTPMVNVTGVGCMFLDIATFHGFASNTAQVCWAEAGGRNYYGGVQFLGMGATLAAGHTGGRSLTISGAGAGENLFVGCTIGLDTIARGVANASLELLAGTPRNVMRNCMFQMLASAATPVHITVGSGGMDRYLMLDNPIFMNAVDSTGTTIDADIVANASAGGTVALQNAFSVGATAIATTGPVRGTGNIPTAATSGIAIALT